jgi:hypothetical protein
VVRVSARDPARVRVLPGERGLSRAEPQRRGQRARLRSVVSWVGFDSRRRSSRRAGRGRGGDAGLLEQVLLCKRRRRWRAW